MWIARHSRLYECLPGANHVARKRAMPDIVLSLVLGSTSSSVFPRGLTPKTRLKDA